ncbi:uncharacterized protein LOC111708067 [Eurytemora carolleeae]|uniref:uncharacterized protein LOC111708067 n=1 Tax=Eurytemora carolleeae TaxID=1294199 RepID=UPI000C78C010|nr:uncharacterized protein LOC111708067 [Eurytemora carolleeae]|eukprot:XP_023337087.1 uncharacterized protein LOC111708067 [Eurytemora affinis]
MFDEFMTKSGGTGRTWEDLHNLAVERDIPPPLLLQENIRSLKLDLLSSIFQGLYPTEGDCRMVRHFISCPASLEEKYHMMRLADLLKRNKKDGVSLETLAEAMCQLARIEKNLGSSGRIMNSSNPMELKKNLGSSGRIMNSSNHMELNRIWVAPVGS